MPSYIRTIDYTLNSYTTLHGFIFPLTYKKQKRKISRMGKGDVCDESHPLLWRYRSVIGKSIMENFYDDLGGIC